MQWPVIMMSHQNVQPHVSINEVACLLPNRQDTDGVSKGVGAPHQCSRVYEQRSGFGESALACQRNFNPILKGDEYLSPKPPSVPIMTTNRRNMRTSA